MGIQNTRELLIIHPANDIIYFTHIKPKHASIYHNTASPRLQRLLNFDVLKPILIVLCGEILGDIVYSFFLLPSNLRLLGHIE